MAEHGVRGPRQDRANAQVSEMAPARSEEAINTPKPMGNAILIREESRS